MLVLPPSHCWRHWSCCDCWPCIWQVFNIIIIAIIIISRPW